MGGEMWPASCSAPEPHASPSVPCHSAPRLPPPACHHLPATTCLPPHTPCPAQVELADLRNKLAKRRLRHAEGEEALRECESGFHIRRRCGARPGQLGGPRTVGLGWAGQPHLGSSRLPRHAAPRTQACPALS